MNYSQYISNPAPSPTPHLPNMAIGTPSFTNVASIPKLKGKVNYEE